MMRDALTTSSSSSVSALVMIVSVLIMLESVRRNEGMGEAARKTTVNGMKGFR